jgi:hypothetical protein
VIEDTQIVPHKAHDPHLVADLFDADVLPGELIRFNPSGTSILAR